MTDRLDRIEVIVEASSVQIQANCSSDRRTT